MSAQELVSMVSTLQATVDLLQQKNGQMQKRLEDSQQETVVWQGKLEKLSTRAEELCVELAELQMKKSGILNS
jgi:outer membrane murein-binding lipoprotein Lpp